MNKIVFKLLFVLLWLNLYPLMADEIESTLEIRSAAFFILQNVLERSMGMLVEAIN